MSQLDLAPFFRTIRRARIAFIVLAVLCLPLGVLMFFLDDSTMSERANLALQVAFGGLFLALGSYLAFMGLRPATRNKGIRTLLERRDEIVWIYPVRQMQGGNHVATRFQLNLADGKSRHVAVVPADEERAERFLQSHCSGARFGFRREWEQQYKSDPASMLPSSEG